MQSAQGAPLARLDSWEPGKTLMAPEQRWPVGLTAVVSALALATVFLLPPIPQDPAYHLFADRLAVFGIPNFWNVVSNLPFVAVGILGLLSLPRLQVHVPVPAYLLCCLGVILVGAGSAYYHYGPDSNTLVWDRVPMSIAFMALFSIVIADRISISLGRWLLWPLVFMGVGSVLYWDWTELQGRGDLRAYGLVQFLPMLLMPLMLITAGGRGVRAALLWLTLGVYVLAKLAEHFDAGIYVATGFVSGHSLKHVLGALAIYFALLAVLRPRPASPGQEQSTAQTGAAT
jgi:hypothetical protein